MRNSVLALFIALSLTLAMGFLDSRNLKATEVPGKASDAVQYVILISLASQLLQEGRYYEIPFMIASAAELIESVVIQGQQWEKASEESVPADSASPDVPLPTSAPASSLKLDASAIFDEAEFMASYQNNELLAETFRQRASIISPAQSSYYALEHTDRVNPRTRDVFTHSFTAGEPAIVLLVTYGDYDLDLQIYDTNGNTMCYHDENYNNMCRFTPSVTQDYQLKVINTTTHYVDYALYTN
jgi:hypothetical protein